MKSSYKKLWIELTERETSKVTLKRAWAGDRYNEQAFKK